MPRRPPKPAAENPRPTTLSLTLHADYHQLHLTDAEQPGDLSDAWTEQAVEDRVAVAERIMGIGSERAEDVRVSVELLEAEPSSETGAFEHVTEASLSVPSGELAVLGCTDYLPDAARLRVPAGPLRVRTSHTSLAKGRETVHVQLWPAVPAPAAVLRRWAPPVRKKSAKAGKPAASEVAAAPAAKSSVAKSSGAKSSAAEPAAAKSASRAAKPVRNIKQARVLALQGQSSEALDALLALAAAGDASASASAAELLAFQGRWADVAAHATALLAHPEAVYAGNVFDDMCALIRRAARDLNDPTLVQRAAAAVPPARQARVNAVLLQDSPNLSADVGAPDLAHFTAAVQRAKTDERFAGKPQQLARHGFALAVTFRVQDEIIARFDPENPELRFDAAVSTALAHARKGDPAAAWAVLESKLHAFWPVDKAQVAPVVLLVHSLLAPLMTAERCEQVLATARAGEA